jgi:LacI family transcriptional regulator
MVTIKDIATELHLDPSTVSRVLNNSPEISQTTKTKVLNLVEQRGYRPNRNAQNLVNNNTYTIGFMIPDIGDSFFSISAANIEQVLRDHGHEIVYCSTQRKSENVLDFVKRAIDYRYSGIFITPDVWDQPLIQLINSIDIPIVSLRRKPPKEIKKVPFVDSDHAGGMASAVDHLVGLGHRHIAFIGFVSAIENEREAGYLRAMHRHHLTPVSVKDDFIGRMALRIAAGHATTRKLLFSNPELTAICASDDYIAIGVMEGLHQQGIRIQEQFSVTGADDREISGLFCTQITTVAQFQDEMGNEAAKMMIKMIHDKSYIPKSLTLPTKLIIRNSTGLCKS